MGTPKGTVPWNAGTGKGWTDKRGYRWLYVNENGRRRARREHRVLMERHLERRLEPWEVVHHIDKNPTNNSLDNLKVIEFGQHTAGHHTGSKRDYETRRSMEAFALVREELKNVRRVNSDLLAALVQLHECSPCQNGCAPDDMSCASSAAKAAIRKATGHDPA